MDCTVDYIHASGYFYESFNTTRFSNIYCEVVTKRYNYIDTEKIAVTYIYKCIIDDDSWQIYYLEFNEDEDIIEKVFCKNLG